MKDYFQLNYSVMSIEETVSKIVDEKSSLARYGDGEFLLMKNKRIRFQNRNSRLGEELNEILLHPEPGLLVTIPPVFSSLYELDDVTQKWWKKFLRKNAFFLKKKLDSSVVYGNSFISRPYLAYLLKEKCEERFCTIKSIWEKQDIIMIEGRYTRLGYNNDLFDNASSVKRIICPNENAFDKIDEIEGIAEKMPIESLFLIALGPTATVLASRMHKKGFWAIDIGHIDIEYEWYKAKASKKIPINNKIVNEAGAYKSLILESVTESYKQQIVVEIE